MFWGLIMEPNKRYTQTVEKAFHLSMASLDAATASNDLVQVMICYDNRNYLLCTLQKNSIWQVSLDLNFQEGTKIAFTCNGNGHVHLTGYLLPDDEGLDDIDDFDEGEFEDEDEEIPQLVGQKKRKAETSPKPKTDPRKAKKSKIEADEDEDDDDDDSDDNDEVEGLEDDSDDDDDDDDDVDGEDEDDDDEEEDEKESDEDEENEEEEPETPVKLSKNQKRKLKKQNLQNEQNQQKNQSQQQNKKEKTKMVNGKDTVKPEKEQGKQNKNKDDSKVESQKTVEGGVKVEDIKVGAGAPAKAGKFVSVYYTGRLKNGKKFDQTQQGEGFKFRLGKGEVIKGWDVGIVGMKVGGKRRLTIPPNMAYGAKGSPPVIPPNSQLNFEVELKAVH